MRGSKTTTSTIIIIIRLTTVTITLTKTITHRNTKVNKCVSYEYNTYRLK